MKFSLTHFPQEIQCYHAQRTVKPQSLKLITVPWNSPNYTRSQQLRFWDSHWRIPWGQFLKIVSLYVSFSGKKYVCQATFTNCSLVLLVYISQQLRFLWRSVLFAYKIHRLSFENHLFCLTLSLWLKMVCRWSTAYVSQVSVKFGPSVSSQSFIDLGSFRTRRSFPGPNLHTLL